MVEDVSSALAEWFSSSVDGDGDSALPVRVGEPTDVAPVGLVLLAVREQVARRTTAVHEQRDPDGRVIERRDATRFFEIDYGCVTSGDALRSHAALGRIVQLLVDDDVVPARLLQPSQTDSGPIEVDIVSSEVPARLGPGEPSLIVRAIVPVCPTPRTEIAPPAEDLHLDMRPAPDPDGNAMASPVSGDDIDPRGLLATREWRTVRRREHITPEPIEASSEQPAARRSRSSKQKRTS